VARHGERRARVVFDASMDVSQGTDAYFHGLYPDPEVPRAVTSLFAIQPAALDTAVDDDDDNGDDD
jgi:hypothetical protein